MKRYAIFGIAVAVALCGCGRGRSSRQESSPNTATTASADAADKPMTVVGCLVANGATTERREPATSNNPQPVGFTLVDVTIPAQSSATPPPVSGTSGTSTPSVQTGTRPSFSLVADKDRLDDLQRFANSRVQVSGQVAASTGTGVSDIGTGPAPAGDARRLRVKDVRQLEPTCGTTKKQ